ncbi:hypothetical protein [Bradyrhizobium sp. Y36]|uniref:hypothetical protein n=1 Tax=Bradyrhizobium sp. Y36 TaxID=2035447 RepID=UPI001177CE2F|nr:hypothetical protein [Bradyrhizobium sp. Y36]
MNETVSPAVVQPARAAQAAATYGGIGGNGGVANDTYQARYGTATAPTNGAAATGTALGSQVVQVISTASSFTTLAAGGLITGLTPGTQYWFDIALASGSGTASLQNVTCSAKEF